MKLLLLCIALISFGLEQGRCSNSFFPLAGTADRFLTVSSSTYRSSSPSSSSSEKEKRDASQLGDVLVTQSQVPGADPPIREWSVSWDKTEPIFVIFRMFIDMSEDFRLSSPYNVTSGPQTNERYITARFDTAPFSNQPIASLTGYNTVLNFDASAQPLSERYCIDDDVCTVESQVGDSRIRERRMAHTQYIEQTTVVTISQAVNCRIMLSDGRQFDMSRNAMFVLPARIPGSAQSPNALLLSTQPVIPDEFCSYQISLVIRVGNFSVPGDGYLYDFPFVGTMQVDQAFFGTFSHQADTASQYSVDFAMTDGTPVYSARSGVVFATLASNSMSKFDPAAQCPTPVTRTCATPGSDANYVLVRHDDGSWGEYSHLRLNGVAVQVGDRVTSKTLLGYSGNTGFSGEPHLHFQVSKAASFCSSNGWTKEPIYFSFTDGSCNAVTATLGTSYTGSSANPSCPMGNLPTPAKLVSTDCAQTVLNPGTQPAPPVPPDSTTPTDVSPTAIPLFVWIIVGVVVGLLVIGLLLVFICKPCAKEEEHV